MCASSETLSSQFSSESKSSCSKSSRSSRTTTSTRQQESSSHIDLETRVQSERLIAVLDETIAKSKVAASLPHLIQNNVLVKILSPGDLKKTLAVYRKSASSEGASSKITSVERNKSGNFSTKRRLNPQLTHLMYTLFKYTELRSRANDFYEKNKSSDNPSGPIAYVHILESLRECMMRQLETTAAEELKTKLESRASAAACEVLKNKIKDLQKSISGEKRLFERDMRDKERQRERLTKQLAGCTAEAKAAMAKEMLVESLTLHTERLMVVLTRSHAARIEFLREQEATWSEATDNTLEKHLRAEKDQRTCRTKVMTQLANWIQKYDLDMAEKQREMDDLEEMYKDEVKMVRELETQMAEQDVEYISLMEEREAEYHEEMTRKMNTFLRDQAARVIQFAWRSVLANREEKIRLKKLQRKLEKAAKKME